MATHERSDRKRAGLATWATLALMAALAGVAWVTAARVSAAWAGPPDGNPPPDRLHPEGMRPEGTRLGITSLVVELFTSQGCSRCPPADRLIGELAREPGTVALSYPVSTWDFAGWHDTLASPSFTERQAAYAAARGDRRVFTPQAIVDGVAAEPGADRDAILRDAAAHRDAIRVPLDLSEGDGTLHIQLGAASAEGPAGVYVLRVAREKTVQIDRGVNSGRSATYTNVVRAIRRIGEWTGAPLHFDVLELKGDGEGYVVLLQAGAPDKPGAILAAGKTPGL